MEIMRQLQFIYLMVFYSLNEMLCLEKVFFLDRDVEKSLKNFYKLILI